MQHIKTLILIVGLKQVLPLYPRNFPDIAKVPLYSQDFPAIGL